MSETAISKSCCDNAIRAVRQANAGSRIAARFANSPNGGELGLVAYVTAGDPSLEASEKIVLAAAEAGADVIELGVPFSDPVADGPTIQRASERALRAGTTLPACSIWCAGFARTPKFRSCFSAISIRFCKWASRNSQPRPQRQAPTACSRPT